MKIKAKSLPKWAKKINDLVTNKKGEQAPPDTKVNVSKEPTQ